jgi:4-hydroxy-tetrahydrodipicolinate synthase
MSRKKDFSGLAVALATPFTAAGEVDVGAFRKLVRHVVKGGADVLVPLGTTGESATLEERERDVVIEATLEEAQGRTVLAGTGHNSTRQAARWTARAQQLGCAGALVVTPYYNKPTPDGLVAHYAAVADAAPGLPIVAYNVPGRTALNVTPATLARLWANPQIVAVKESSGDVAQIGAIARALPPGKTLLAGDDSIALASIAVGAAGLVSVVGNVLPAETKQLVDAARAGDLATAQRLQRALLPVIEALFAVSSPIPLKAALALRGLAEDCVRLPLVRAPEDVRARLEAALDAFPPAR